MPYKPHLALKPYPTPQIVQNALNRIMDLENRKAFRKGTKWCQTCENPLSRAHRGKCRDKSIDALDYLLDLYTNVKRPS